MTSNTNDKRHDVLRKALTGVALATGGAVLLAGGAQAQTGGEGAPDGFQAANDLPNVDSVRTLADGSAEITLTDGRVLVFEAADVAVVEGEVYIAQGAIDAVDFSVAASAGGGGGAGVALGVLGGGALLGAAAGGGGGGGSTPPPDPNDPPSFTSGTDASAAENTTGGVYTATATDPDGDNITFSISGGADASLFSINGSTGVLTFNAPPDFENPGDAGGDNVYEVTIRASDGSATVEQTVTITVTDEDEAPAFSSGATASVAENSVGVAYTAAAADPEGAAVTYSLGGTDAALFTIDATTGEVSFIASPDHENPQDANADNVYDITVTASDGTNASSQDVAITVTDVNESAPVFTSGTSVGVDEGVNGTIYTAAATDGDGSTVTYSIVPGGDGADFAIDADTGELTFVSSPDFENPADGNTDNVYEVTIRASDGERTTDQTVQVTVSDVNEAPAITSGTSVSVAENLAATVYTVTATDEDGDALTYSISGADAALFTIDANTGEVEFVVAPDFENPTDADGDNNYQITVTASDGTLSDSQDVTISVTGANEFAPVFTSGATASVAEGTADPGYTATATDGDGDTVTYSIVGGADAGDFTIDSATGQLLFVGVRDFEAPTDADTDNVYEVTIRATDGNYNTDQTVNVTVTNVNEAPALSIVASTSVDENQTAVYTASATDPDGDALTYSLTGADAALFSIDANTGEITFNAPPDYENPGDADGDNTYQVTVNVSDGTLSDSGNLDIVVQNVNDNAPVFTSASAVSVPENVTGVVYDTNATDADGDGLTYSIIGGADASLFTIDANTGEVTFNSSPDFEAPADANTDNVYHFAVRVSDGTNTTDQNISITVTDQDEAGAPTFQSALTSTVSETQTSAYVISAVDAQGDTITYSISGTDAALFSVDSATGEVTFNTAPDFEAPADAGGNNVYDITVTASDGTNSNSQDVEITVSDVTDGADVANNDTTEIRMVSGGSYTGNLEADGDTDWIAVELTAGQRYQFNLTGTGVEELEDPLIRLYDSSGNLIAENDDIDLGVVLDSQLGFTASTSGTYYIEVNTYSGSGSTVDSRTGQYTVDVVHTDPLRNWSYQEIADYLRSGFGGAQFNASSGDTITVNITGLTAAGQFLAREALEVWSDVTGLNFSEVTGTAQITFDDEETGAFAGPDGISGGFFTSASVNVGTEWLTTYGTTLDTYSFQTYIHEIGHALGLGHAGPYDGSATYGIDNIYLNDSWQATVMSYFSQNENTEVDASLAFVVGLQVADIIAAHDMYGASTTTRVGDTTYGYNSNAGTIYDANNGFSNATTFTVFDSGGTDTFDYSGSSASQTIDLREEHYSSVRGLTGNVGIANGTVIENAIGGSGNDTLIGNDADNTLTGNGGNDRFFASGGSDTFVGGSGSDTAIFSGAAGDYTVSTNGSGNTVVTDNRAGSPDGTVELIGVETIEYDGGTTYPGFFQSEDAGEKHFVQTDFDLASLPAAGGGGMPVMASLSDDALQDFALSTDPATKLPVQTDVDLQILSKWDGSAPVMDRLSDEGHTDLDIGADKHHDDVYPHLDPDDWAEFQTQAGNAESGTASRFDLLPDGLDQIDLTGIATSLVDGALRDPFSRTGLQDFATIAQEPAMADADVPAFAELPEQGLPVPAEDGWL